jgi:hypothetical protein
MATRSRGASAGFGWLNRGIGAGFRHPKPLFGGAALLLLVVFIPALITLPLQWYALRSATPLSPLTVGGIMAISMLLSLLVLPFYAGYLQVVEVAEQGLPARAGGIIKPYREGKALRVIGYGVVMLVIYVAMFAAIIAATGGGFAHWYMQVLTAQAHHLPPPTALPNGFGITLLLFMVALLFMMGFYAISLGQVALGNRSVLGAIGEGVIGALKNLLPLLMLTVALLLLWIAVGLGFGILALVLIFIGKLVGPWLVVVLLFPLYIALFLTTFTAMFGVMYHLWRDVCTTEAAGVA